MILATRTNHKGHYFAILLQKTNKNSKITKKSHLFPTVMETGLFTTVQNRKTRCRSKRPPTSWADMWSLRRLQNKDNGISADTPTSDNKCATRLFAVAWRSAIKRKQGGQGNATAADYAFDATALTCVLASLSPKNCRPVGTTCCAFNVSLWPRGGRPP